MVNWASTKVTKITREKKLLFWNHGQITLEKKLFHKWEYEKKDKEERATSATSTLRSSRQMPSKPILDQNRKAKTIKLQQPKRKNHSDLGVATMS